MDMKINGSLYVALLLTINPEINEGVVSKETMVLRRWGSSIQKFGFINGVDNVNWPPYRDSNPEISLICNQASFYPKKRLSSRGYPNRRT